MAYLVGRGIADITGEAAGAGMLGYGKSDQKSAGIHLRLRSRAFVIEADGAGVGVLLLVVAELPLVFDSVRRAVLARLAERFGARYTGVNTMITGTHTHSGPGGYSHHRLYNFTTGGFRPKTFAAIVSGIVESVARAHDELAAADLGLAFGELHDASVNRSPTSFARNPADERAFFPAAIDPQVTLLTVRRAGGLAATITWFATHGTSMSNRNRLISSDNKGYAAYHWERVVCGVDYLAGPPAFVAAFAQTNAGDMSPNLNRRASSGPTEDEFANTRIIGGRQYGAGASLVDDAKPLGEGVDARLTHVDLHDFEVDARFCPDGRPHRTSGPYAAAAQLAGTDEGKGFAGFRQGGNPVFDAVSSALLYRLSPELRDSQAPKALVLPRAVNRVVPLIQERVPVQLWRIGTLYLVGIPGEVTIVAGLRLRRAVAEVVGTDVAHVLVAGYSNGYIHYVTTPEEYPEQRYEGGSTMYGRWELPALVQTAVLLAEAMRDGVAVDAGVVPPDLSPGVRPRRDEAADAAVGGDFGDLLAQPRGRYRAGETVRAEFVGTSPNSDQRRGATFVEVQVEVDGEWRRVADDGDWATRFHWRRAGRRGSRVTVSWDVPAAVAPGRYRLVYSGDVREPGGTLRTFTSATEAFAVG